ncbi:MAG: hypothetical protein M3277_05040 [Actinomycetota bacterium]|nr:hypothetical protein [Actinomycetota bacterium]
MTARDLVFGEWNPVVRDPLDLLRGIFVGGAAILAASGDRAPFRSQ